MKSRMRSALFRKSLTAFIGVAACGSLPATLGGELSPRFTAPTKCYANTKVIYDSALDSTGDRLRVIVTRPYHRCGNQPVTFEAGWLSRDSAEALSSSADPSSQVFRVLAELPGMTVRVDFSCNVKCQVLVHRGILGLPRLLED